MPKFRYYIVSFDGVIHGTDDRQIAIDFAQSDDFAVVDALSGEQLRPGDEAIVIEGI